MNTVGITFPSTNVVKASIREDNKDIPIGEDSVPWKEWWQKCTEQQAFEYFYRSVKIDKQTVMRNAYKAHGSVQHESSKNWVFGMGTSIGLTPTKAVDKITACTEDVRRNAIEALMATLPANDPMRLAYEQTKK